MENIEQIILDLLSDKKARDSIEIINYLSLGKKYDAYILETLKKMTERFDLYSTKKNKYMLFSDSELSKNFVKGKFLDTNNEYGFVEISKDEEDIFIHGSKCGGAIDGDIVLVEITKGSRNDKKCEGRIAKIISHEMKMKIGEVYHYDNKAMVSLDDKRFKKLVALEGDKNNIDRLVDGDKVQVEFLNNNDDSQYLHATFVKRIGHINDPDIDILGIIADNGFDVEFPDSVIEELTKIPTEVLEKDLVNRRDLQNEMIFTIDGDDTRDIDDAISVKILDNGHFQLGVHIADVSYYVKENSPLDLEARNRGTSVYLTDRVIPMLPHQLSNGICSLNPNVPRLATSCVMEIDDKGNVVDYEIFESVIKSRIQMTYKKVNAYLEKGIVSDGYEEFTEALSLMKKLSDIVRNNKIKRGFIDFDTDEIKINVDEKGVPIKITKREHGIGERIIEDFMILANETVANHLFYMDLPSVYRIHGNPNEDRLRKFINVLGSLGINLKLDLNKITPKTIQAIIDSLKDYPEFPVLSILMLSCMDKAIYASKNIGHFGIASKCYTHFTSPIRRYPDTTIHRLLKEYFFSKDGITEDKLEHFESILPDICDHASERERASVSCEREVDAMKMAEYMKKHIGEQYQGMVSGITKVGMFVQLDNLIEGLVPILAMDDFYVYDDRTESLIGQKTHNRYTIGNRVIVEVVKASKEDRQIDFKVIEKVDVNEAGKKKVKTKYS